MIGGVTCPGWLPGLPGRVTLSAGETVFHVNVSRWSNPPGQDRSDNEALIAASTNCDAYTFTTFENIHELMTP